MFFVFIMEDKVVLLRLTRFNIFVWIVMLLLYTGEFLRIKMVLNEQRARVNKLEKSKNPTQGNKNTPDVADFASARHEKEIDNIKTMLNAQITRMNHLENENNNCWMNIFVKAGFKRQNRPRKNGAPGLDLPRGKKEQNNKNPFSSLKRKKRAIIPDQQQMAAELAELKRDIHKIIQALGALQFEKEIPGPREPPGQSVVPPRSVIISPPRLAVNESQSAILNCSASGYPQPVFAWSKVNGSLPKERFIVDSSGALRLKQVRPHDSGTYQCKATNILGSEQSNVTIEVNYAPRVTLSGGPVFKEMGKNIVMPRCWATGRPKPNITWLKSGGSLDINSTIIKDGQMTLLRSKKEDSGTYSCKAENRLGIVTKKTILIVVELPKFTVKPPTSLVAIPGKTIRLNCSAKGDFPITITWKKENGALPSGSSEERDGSLIIKDFKKADSGVYVCTAKMYHKFEKQSKSTVYADLKDCSEIYNLGERRDGVYTVQPAESQSAIQVYCDMTTDGGGWTVFQRRIDGSIDFYRNWQQYKKGFGNLNGEFWLGNDYIHKLTARTASSLRVELGDWDGTRIYAKYGSFSVANESDKYRLRVDSYSGTAGDSLAYHKNMMFTTKDRYNDLSENRNCAVENSGAWWYGMCSESSLNGIFSVKIGMGGKQWYTYKRIWSYGMKTTEMKFRPQI